MPNQSNMTTSDVITLGIALLGLGISIFLAIREYRKEKRQVSIFLEGYVYHPFIKNIVLVNVGLRPVTISDMVIAVYHETEDTKYWEYLSHYELFATEPGEKSPIPFSLSDGEQLKLGLSGYTIEKIQAPARIRVQVYDADGNVYNKFKHRHIDTRLGTHYAPDYTNIEMSWHQRLRLRLRSRYHRIYYRTKKYLNSR